MFLVGRELFANCSDVNELTKVIVSLPTVEYIGYKYLSTLPVPLSNGEIMQPHSNYVPVMQRSRTGDRLSKRAFGSCPNNHNSKSSKSSFHRAVAREFPNEEAGACRFLSWSEFGGKPNNPTITLATPHTLVCATPLEAPRACPRSFWETRQAGDCPCGARHMSNDTKE